MGLVWVFRAWAGVGLAASFAILLSTPSLAAIADKDVKACLDEMGVVEKPSSGSSAGGQNGLQIVQTTSISGDPIKALRVIMANACYVMPLKQAREVVDTAVAYRTDKLPEIHVGGRPVGSVREPGLLGLDGAEDVLTEMLVGEAYGLWIMGRNAGSELPAPTGEQVQAYVDVHLEQLRKEPDGAMSLRIRAWEKLKEIVLGREKPSSEEQKFVHSVEEYIRAQHIRMAREAKRKYKAYQEEQNRRSTSTQGMAVLFHTGHEPYDPLAEMKKALTMSSSAAVLMGTLAVTKELLNRQEAEIVESLTLKNVPEKEVGAALEEAEAAAKKAGKKLGSSVLKAMSKIAKVPAKLAGKLVAKIAVAAIRVTGMLGLKAVNVVPIVGQIIDVIITSAEQISKLDKITRIEKDLETAEARYKAADWSLKKLMNTRSGTETVQYFYVKATSSSSPEDVVIEPPKCRACFFSEKNFTGEFFCTATRVSDLHDFNDGERARKFNNKIRSVQLFGDEKDCKAPAVILNENPRHSGDRLVLSVSAPDLAKVRRGKNGNWDKQASSVEYKRKGAGPKCEVCLFKGSKYTGTKICTSDPIASLHDYSMGDNITSIRFDTGACPDAKLWAYRKKNFTRTSSGGGVAVYTKSTTNVGKKWNDKFSSVYFSPTGTSPKEAKATDGCRACLYNHSGYRGDYVCLSVGDRVQNLDKYVAGGDTFKFAHQTSSVQFITTDCKPGEQLALALYSDPKFKGQREILTKSVANLGKFNDKAESAILAYRTKEQAEKTCRVCLYTRAGFKGDRKCFDGDYKDLGKLKFADKAESIKFELEKCEKTGAAVFYSKKDEKGDRLYAYKDIPDLKNQKRGKKGHWKDTIAGFSFDEKLRPTVEATFKKLKMKAPWAHIR